MLAHQIAGHTHTKEKYEEQLCHTDNRIHAVQKSIFDLGVSVAKATEIRRAQLSELVTVIPYIAGATELPKTRCRHGEHQDTPQRAVFSDAARGLVVTSTYNGLPPDNVESFATGFRQRARQLPTDVHRRETESPWRTVLC